MKSLTLVSHVFIKITNIPEKGKNVPYDIKDADAVAGADGRELAA
jgi:hypothetical protein